MSVAHNGGVAYSPGLEKPVAGCHPQTGSGLPTKGRGVVHTYLKGGGRTYVPHQNTEFSQNSMFFIGVVKAIVDLNIDFQNLLPNCVSEVRS